MAPNTALALWIALIPFGTVAVQPESAASPPDEIAMRDGDAALDAARRGFLEVSGWVSQAADLVPAGKYSYRPIAGVRTFAQLVAHLADSYAYYCAQGAGRKVEWSDAVEKGAADKATLVQRLKQATEACRPVYEGTGQIAPLIENVGHTSLHYGNMITYLRMMGLTPPSS